MKNGLTFFFLLFASYNKDNFIFFLDRYNKDKYRLILTKIYIWYLNWIVKAHQNTEFELAILYNNNMY